MTNRLDERLLLKELDDNTAWMQVLFKELVAWYTFFITANVALMGWLVTKDTQSIPEEVPIVMLILDACGIGLVGLSWRYLMKADSRARDVTKRLNSLAGLADSAGIRSVFPRHTVTVGLFFLVLGLVALGVVWLKLPLN